MTLQYNGAFLLYSVYLLPPTVIFDEGLSVGLSIHSVYRGILNQSGLREALLILVCV